MATAVDYVPVQEGGRAVGTGDGRVDGANAHAPGRDPGHFVRGMERWRVEVGVSMNAFADYLGVSRSYYSQVRRGLRPVTMALVKRVLRERPDLAYALPVDAADPTC